jgi:tetratricopeptide (TPR) repeat protein
LGEALELAGGLAWFWGARGHATEGRDHLAQLLGLPGEVHPRARVAALLGGARLAWTQGDYAAQERLATESLTIARALGDPKARAVSLIWLAQAANSHGDYVKARGLLEECVETCRRDRSLVAAEAESLLGNTARDQGDFSSARACYDAALAHETTASGRGHILSNLGWLAYYQGDLEGARGFQEESLQLRRQLGEPRSIAVSLTVLGKIAFAQGNPSAALALYAASLPLHQEVRNQWGIALVLEGLAVLEATAHPRRALRLAGAAATVRQLIGRPLPPAERPILDSGLAHARQALGAEASAAAWVEGQALSMEQAVAAALQQIKNDSPDMTRLEAARRAS